ncbi:VOC family protein [Flavobacterium sp.]|uniref:VOC family protein n=1 Tax=Flavobacterium sp. TaxID=239 RepID=UPI0031D01B65
MTTLNPYIYFNGNCEEAFNFYKRVFRKEITYIGRYGDVPKTDRNIFEETDEKIMHITLPISEETVLSGSDNKTAYKESIEYTNFSLIIHTDSKAEADRLFNEMSEDGQVKVPVDLAFWGSYYGICIDRFGINWKITTEEK